MDVNERIAARVRNLRAERGYTLDALAERSGVSRSMISLVERGESSPTASVLDKLAAGLGVTLAALFEDEVRAEAASPLARHGAQPVWQDPASGYVRRNVSPPGYPSAIQLVAVEFPPGKRVAYDGASRDVEIDQQVWLVEGVMEVTVGSAVWRLEPGDCLAMQLDKPIAYRNPGRKPARYLVALASVSHPASTRNR